MRVAWRGPVADPSGYAAGGRAWVRGLAEEGVEVSLEPTPWNRLDVLTGEERDRLAALTRPAGDGVDAAVHHTFGGLLSPYRAGRLRVGRTMFETDRIPDPWVARCNQMDQVWVPTGHNREAFAASGVREDLLVVLPEPFELDRLDPSAAPLELPEAHGTVFLAVMDWSLRKGWDVLLDAWCRAFTAHDDVTLVLKAWSTTRGMDISGIEAEAGAHLVALGHDPAAVPDVVILDRLLDDAGTASMYAAADVLVAPTRGEGWGRPAVEAMAMGRPVVATAWSGPGEFVDDSVGWPLPYRLVPVPDRAVREVPAYAGHRWAEPDTEALAAALAQAHADPAGRAARGAAARERAAGFGHRAVARRAIAALDRGRPRLAAAPRRGRLCVAIEGGVFRAQSLDLVNRELARVLAGGGRADVALVDREGRPPGGHPDLAPLATRLLPRAPDVTLRQAYPPDLRTPALGHLVAVLPWEFGPAPVAWAGAAGRTVDEVWVYSEHTRRGYLEAGAPPDRVAVVPAGVDVERFRPGAEPMDLGGRAPGFRFLFVGGLIWRKGADILLDAYRRAFGPHDDVTLVVKDFGAGGPYAPEAAEDLLRRLAADPAAPRVLHLSGPMPDADMPGLYAACDCLVHPYRGEGYGLPVAEAMACGLPVVIPAGGSTADFADAGTAILVPAPEVRHAAREVAGIAVAGAPRLLEPSAADVAAAMREVAARPDRARGVGAAAAARIREGHTWRHAGDRALERLEAVVARPAVGAAGGSRGAARGR